MRQRGEIFNCQGTGGPRFEHLAAKRDGRVTWFKHNVRLLGARGTRWRGNGQVPRFQHNTRRKYFGKICDAPFWGSRPDFAADGLGNMETCGLSPSLHSS